MPDDPFTDAARDLLIQTLDDLRPKLVDLPPAALNWKPAGDGSNSIAVLAVHVMASTRSWLSVAVGAPLPDRDRASEFLATSADPAALLAHVDDMRDQCDRLLVAAKDVDWSAMRQTHPRPRPGAEQTVTAAWALLHALEHLREHAGHIALTRQLWDQQHVS
jgi:uncharacterized damage-inducible protein DinB